MIVKLVIGKAALRPLFPRQLLQRDGAQYGDAGEARVRRCSALRLSASDLRPHKERRSPSAPWEPPQRSGLPQRTGSPNGETAEPEG